VNIRLKVFSWLVVLVFLAIWVRLGYWQIVRGAELAARAESQHFDSLDIAARRGKIISGDGEVLGGTIDRYLLFIYKQKLKAPLFWPKFVFLIIKRIIGSFLYKEPKGAYASVAGILDFYYKNWGAGNGNKYR